MNATTHDLNLLPLILSMKTDTEAHILLVSAYHSKLE